MKTNFVIVFCLVCTVLFQTNTVDALKKMREEIHQEVEEKSRNLSPIASTVTYGIDEELDQKIKQG